MPDLNLNLFKNKLIQSELLTEREIDVLADAVIAILVQ